MSAPHVPQLPLSELAVLALLAQGATHGFALSRELAPDGVVGKVWTVSRPRIYRAIHRLTELALVEPVGTEPGDTGPPRTVVAATALGRAQADRWLSEPVAHLRDMRSELLLKLVLCHRAGIDTQGLLVAQQQRFGPIVERLTATAEQATGIDRLIFTWRAGSARALTDMLDDLLPKP
ncbi:MAG: PadR family transcriptional regulator [Egibacteraceae bacterium]